MVGMWIEIAKHLIFLCADGLEESESFNLEKKGRSTDGIVGRSIDFRSPRDSLVEVQQE